MTEDPRSDWARKPATTSPNPTHGMRTPSQRFRFRRPGAPAHQAVSGILSRMKDKGLIDYAFDGTDRRVKNVYMTPKGEGLYDGLVAVRHEYDRRMEHVLSPEERVKLFELLDRVFEHLHDEI